MASARREHVDGCGARSGGGCDCGGVPFYECSVEKTASGFGMLIGSDCTVTNFNGEVSAGRDAGVVLKSIVVRVNDVPVEDKKDIVEQLKSVASGSSVTFRLIWGKDATEAASSSPALCPPAAEAAASKSTEPAAPAAAGKGATADAVREHTTYCGAKFGRACDCGGVPCYSVAVTNVGAGYGMLIGSDCTVTKFNGEPNAAKTAGVLLDSIIVRVNGVVVEDKMQVVEQIKAAKTGTPVSFKMLPPPGADMAALARPETPANTASDAVVSQSAQTATNEDAVESKAAAQVATVAASAGGAPIEAEAQAAEQQENEEVARVARLTADRPTEAGAKATEANVQEQEQDHTASTPDAGVAKRDQGADCYSVEVTDVGAGYGMLIGTDCTVTKFNGSPSAAANCGVLLNSVIVSVNGTAVENKGQVVAQIQAATRGMPVAFKMVRPPPQVQTQMSTAASSPSSTLQVATAAKPVATTHAPVPEPAPAINHSRRQARVRPTSARPSSPVLGSGPKATFLCKHAARCIAAVGCRPDCETDERNRFLAATCSLREQNELYLLEYDALKNNLECNAVFDHPAEVWRIAACPSREDLIATLHSDSTGRAGGRQSTLWRLTGVGEDAASGALRPLEQLATLSDDDSESHGRGKQLGSTVWSPEGPHAVATTEGRRICIWSLQESDPSVAKLSGRASAPGTISACCWGGPPGSARLLSSSNGDIHTWDARALGGSPTTVAIARAHGGSAVLSLDCNPLKPHQVLSAGGDLLLKCWDVRKATEPLLTLPGHSHWATNARYNPSHDQLVLSASTDHTVRLWGVSSISMEPLGSSAAAEDKHSEGTTEQNDGLRGVYDYHADSIYDIAWARADAFIFASVSYDGQVAVNEVGSTDKGRILQG